jgi:hypothetical protein
MSIQKQENVAVTREDLADLLAAKDLAQRVFSDLTRECREAAEQGLTVEQRVVLDLRKREALKASCAADAAYDAALDRFTSLVAA